MSIDTLREERAKLIGESRELLSQHDGAVPADVLEQYENIEARIGELQKTIRANERLAAIESDLSESRGAIKEDPQAPAGKPTASGEYRSAFQNWIRRGMAGISPEQSELLYEARAQTVGTDTAGGFLVDEEFSDVLIRSMREVNVMRQVATVITTGGDHNIRINDPHGTASYEGELATTTESDETFANVILNAYKLATMVKVSEELLEDSAFPMDTFLANEFAERFGTREEQAFVAGSGTGEPTGIVSSAAAGATAANAASIVEDDLYDLFHSLKRVYRSNGTWLMNDATAKEIRKLKDADGTPLWGVGLNATQPDTLLGRPVAISDFVPGIATTNRSVLFGDMRAYWIGDRGTTTFQRLDERFRDDGQIGFRGYRRHDGKLTLAEKVQALVHP